MVHRPHIIIAVAAVAILVLLAVGLRSYTPYAGRNAMPKQPPSVVLAMEDVHLVGLGREGKLWSARADKVEIGQNRAVTKLSNIHNGRIYSGGKVVLKVQAGQAVYESYRRDLSLSGGIKIEGADGQKMTADGAIWNSTTSSLRSIGQVRFQDEWGRIDAGSLLVDLTNQELGMWNVHMKIELDAVRGDANREAR